MKALSNMTEYQNETMFSITLLTYLNMVKADMLSRFTLFQTTLDYFLDKSNGEGSSVCSPPPCSTT
jgi:hypothetical protein